MKVSTIVRSDLEKEISKALVKILVESLCFFSESDISAHFYYHLRSQFEVLSVPVETGVSIGENRNGELSTRRYPNVALKLSCAGKRFHIMHQVVSRCFVTAQSQAKPTLRTR